jgi:subtilisin family serine protease
MTDIRPVEPVIPAINNKKTGCGTIAVITGLCLYVALGTIVFLVAATLVWEFEFEGLYNIPWLRVGVQAIYAVGLLLFLGPLALWWKNQPARRIFRLLSMAAAYTLMLSIARSGQVDDALFAALTQIGLTLIYLFLLLMIARNRRVDLKTWLKPLSPAHWLIPLIFSGAYALVWAAIGALGSWLDIVTNLVIGLCIGLTASVLLRLGLFTRGMQPSPDQGTPATQGLAASALLAILLVGIAPVGLQYLLIFVIPVIGWILPLLTNSSSANSGKKAGFLLALIIGLAMAIPFIFVDGDELALVTAATRGELLAWVAIAALISLILILLGLLLINLFKNKITSWEFSIPAFVICLLLWGGVITLIVLHRGPVFNGERLFVILKDQADVSQAASIEDYDARRTYVYETLTSHAIRSQADLREVLDGYHVYYQPYYLVNGLEVSGGPLLRLWLENRPEVDRVLDNPILRPLPKAVSPAEGDYASIPDGSNWNLTMIHAQETWADFGVNGSGIIIGQSDSGVDGTHPEFADRYRGSIEGDDYNWLDPWNGSQSPTDIGGHGTHTLATALGSHVGVAPGASWIGCVNLARNLGNPARYLDCMQFMLAPFPQGGDPFSDGEPTLSAHVLTNSWGCPEVEGCDAETFLPAVDALEAAGIFVVVGAGNNGDAGCSSITDPPSLYPSTFTVGAVNADNSLASFSSKGPAVLFGQILIKPDLVAPGVDVLSAFPGGTYQMASGTSMATPHVAGAVALLWSANPDLIGNIELTRRILQESAFDLPISSTMDTCGNTATLPNNLEGYGLLDVYAAVERALTGK